MIIKASGNPTANKIRMGLLSMELSKSAEEHKRFQGKGLICLSQSFPCYVLILASVRKSLKIKQKHGALFPKVSLYTYYHHSCCLHARWAPVFFFAAIIIFPAMP